MVEGFLLPRHPILLGEVLAGAEIAASLAWQNEHGGSAMELQSTITCPDCGFAREETMPTDACVYFYACASCGVRLRPNEGDCCVFCSFGSVPCPPIQAGECCA